MVDQKEEKKFICWICKKELKYKQWGDTYYYGRYLDPEPCVCEDCKNIHHMVNLYLYSEEYRKDNQPECRDFVVTRSLIDGHVL